MSGRVLSVYCWVDVRPYTSGPLMVYCLWEYVCGYPGYMLEYDDVNDLYVDDRLNQFMQYGVVLEFDGSVTSIDVDSVSLPAVSAPLLNRERVLWGWGCYHG